MQGFATENTVVRLWERDSSLWPAEGHQVQSIKSSLRWLDLPTQIEPYIAQVAERAAAAHSAGLHRMVFVAMGSSNLAAVLNAEEANSGKQTYLLDSTDPDALRDLESRLPLDQTLFVFANKSGKRIETHALLLYFLEKLKGVGIQSPGEHFVALTEEGSYLGTLAKTYKFRNIFFDPPGISGRYSGLIHFSLFPTVECQVDKSKLLETIFAMKDACGPSARTVQNPAVPLASFLAAGELQGFKLTSAYIDILRALRDRMRYALGMPVQVSSGPRYLYALGTMYKNGPTTGIL